ncbi:MAG: helix-turn-helix domain-containing protein [Burkholderiales bacterium]|nr:helix-turn-helix domain-containing protein [Burkholderiales bacterium]
MSVQRKKISSAPSAARMVEEIVGCKWSLAVLAAVRRGVRRPGAMEQAIEGVSKKVLNERLRKLVRFGILEKRSYPEVPPRVEYHLTAFGARFSELMDGVERLQRELEQAAGEREAGGANRARAAEPRRNQGALSERRFSAAGHGGAGTCAAVRPRSRTACNSENSFADLRETVPGLRSAA